MFAAQFTMKHRGQCKMTASLQRGKTAHGACENQGQQAARTESDIDMLYNYDCRRCTGLWKIYGTVQIVV